MNRRARQRARQQLLASLRLKHDAQLKPTRLCARFYCRRRATTVRRALQFGMNDTRGRVCSVRLQQRTVKIRGFFTLRSASDIRGVWGDHSPHLPFLRVSLFSPTSRVQKKSLFLTVRLGKGDKFTLLCGCSSVLLVLNVL